MLRRTTLALALGMTVSTMAHADYQLEMGGGYAFGDLQAASGANADQSVLLVTGALYLEPVDTSKGPLGEAAFLDHASGVTLAFTDGEIDFNTKRGGRSDFNSFGASARYVFEESNWLVEGGYRRDEVDIGFNRNNESRGDNFFSLGGGKYIADNTSLVFSYFKQDGGGDEDGISLNMEHLQALELGTLKVEGGIAFVDVDKGDNAEIYSLSGTYYLNPMLGFGATYNLTDAGSGGSDQWSIFSEWFVNAQVALSLAYTEVDEDNSKAGSDAFIFGARARF